MYKFFSKIKEASQSLYNQMTPISLPSSSSTHFTSCCHINSRPKLLPFLSLILPLLVFLLSLSISPSESFSFDYHHHHPSFDRPVRVGSPVSPCEELFLTERAPFSRQALRNVLCWGNGESKDRDSVRNSVKDREEDGTERVLQAKRGNFKVREEATEREERKEQVPNFEGRKEEELKEEEETLTQKQHEAGSEDTQTNNFKAQNCAQTQISTEKRENFRIKNKNKEKGSLKEGECEEWNAFTDEDLPVLAVAASGGGHRCGVSLMASLQALEDKGALDAVSYLVGASGVCV